MRAALPSRDRSAVVAGIVGLTALAWLDLWRRASEMAHEPGIGMNMAMVMPRAISWSVPDLLAAGAMWSVMTTAMMAPSATPMLLFFSGAQRAQQTTGAIEIPAVLFAAGFLLIWIAWAWLAAGLQWALQTWLVLSPQLTVAQRPLAVAFLFITGLYQFTALKHTCLARCQSPLGFLFSQWRRGAWGAAQMGVRYGAYCVGCCWALMGLLFVVGIMNLLWAAVLGIFVLLEKTALRGPWPGRITGTMLIAWALYLLRAPAM
jgi:predicted metal-binding membrane protein